MPAERSTLHRESAAGAERSEQKTTTWAVLVVLGAFGPYLVGGMRTEQAIVYGLLLVGLGAVLASSRRWSRPLRFVLLLWSALAAIAVVGALFPVSTPVGLAPGRLLPAIDNLLLPLALLMLGGYWASRVSDTDRTLRAVAWAIVILSTANAVLSVLQFLGTPLESVLALFWTHGSDSVAARALMNERYTGIFNQPGEAGFVYSLALLSLAYLWIRQAIERRGIYLSLLVVLVAGSYLSQSKIALIVGIPVTAAMLLMQARRSPRAKSGFVSLVSVFVGLGVLGAGMSQWYGAARILTVVSLDTSNASEGIVGLLGAGRYGGTGTLSSSVAAVLQAQPVFGFGATGIDVAYDSAWLELLSTSGLVGLALYLFLLGYLFALAARKWAAGRPAIAVMALGLPLIALGASFGFLPLTSNRGGALFWVLAIFALLGSPPVRYRVPVNPVDSGD